MNPTRHTTRRLAPFAPALATIALAAAMPASSALAASPNEVRQQSLNYSDLNLNSMSGVRRVYARIRKAASAVCGERQGVGSRITQRDWQDCYDRAVADAVAKLDKPALNAYHQRRAGAAG